MRALGDEDMVWDVAVVCQLLLLAMRLAPEVCSRMHYRLWCVSPATLGLSCPLWCRAGNCRVRVEADDEARHRVSYDGDICKGSLNAILLSP